MQSICGSRRGGSGGGGGGGNETEWVGRVEGGGWCGKGRGVESRCVLGEVSVNLVTMSVSLSKTLIDLSTS